MPSSIDNVEPFYRALIPIITGGAFVGWIREKRKSKRDAYDFAMDLLNQQNARIDNLVGQVAKLEAKIAIEADAMIILQQENKELRRKCMELQVELTKHKRDTNA